MNEEILLGVLIGFPLAIMPLAIILIYEIDQREQRRRDKALLSRHGMPYPHVVNGHEMQGRDLRCHRCGMSQESISISGISCDEAMGRNPEDSVANVRQS